MGLRRRRHAQDDASAAPAAAPASSSSAPAPKGRPHPAQGRPSRLRVLLFAAPLLGLWYLVFARRVGPKPLPAHYAICSPRDGQQVVTMDETDGGAHLRTQCIVVNEGVVVGRGSLKEIRSEWGDVETTGKGVGRGGGVRIYFLRKGETLLPGLIDAHAHVLQQGESATAVDLVGATSVTEVVDRIARFIASDPALQADKSRFILGLGWDQTRYSDTAGAFPTADDLERDPRLRGRPIYLKRIDVHALWVSRAVLALLPADLPLDVPGGEIVRSADGRPTGVFLDNAMPFITAVIPPWTTSSRMQFLRATALSMLQHGLTSVHDAALTPADVRFLRKLDEQGRLPVRIYGFVGCEPTNAWCGDDEGVERYEGDRFTVRAAKQFTDGALGSFGAAMHEPYSDAPSKKGFLITEEEELEPIIQKWIAKGFQVNSHGIGDRANTVVLDIYERALRNLTRADGRDPDSDDELRKTQKEVRFRVEHAQIMTQEDIKRMGRLGLIASFQPTHATSDMGYAEERLGPERIKGAYAWRSLLDAGAPYALGSDFPVESVNPFLGLYAATTRNWADKGREGDSPHGRGGWYPAERLTPLEALRGFTTSAAYASFAEHRVGVLSPGALADFIVVQGDPLDAPAEGAPGREEWETRLREMKVRSTVVGGRVMHGGF
ncbi:amidohydrolase family-domain-containing protein [Rhodotorula diobovata]|uniref:Amidohydrolase family-domain-containing protein n=1 Tax=Rhodotorula diobovata TaxID=5288 RepID=A0A5C5FQ60_9BASI|nr:amidohydrolase family-domain-containing protein [Rhodotorula diobovata]